MDIVVKRVAIGLASAFLASVGFVLSVFAVVLTPLIPASPVMSPSSQIQRRYSANSPFIHGKPHISRPDSGISNSVESDIASQTTSNTSLSSPSTSAVDPPHLRLRRQSSSDASLRAQRYAYRQSTPPQQRSPVQRLESLPTSLDHLSPNASSSTGIHVPDTHEVYVESPRIISAPASPPVLPTASSPPAPFLVAPPPARSPVLSTSSPVQASPASADCDHVVHFTKPQNSHSFRIPSLKRRNKISRPTTCPDPEFIPKPEQELTVLRSSSRSSLKSFCPGKMRERRTLRKSLSTEEYKSSKTKCDHYDDNTKAESTHTLKPSAPFKLSRARTQPYEAPYFFPTPGSPDAVNYIRKAREEKTALRTPRHFPSLPVQQRQKEEEISKRAPVQRGTASAPPIQVHFVT